MRTPVYKNLGNRFGFSGMRRTVRAEIQIPIFSNISLAMRSSSSKQRTRLLSESKPITNCAQVGE
jgi:hypothetical protein